MIKLSLRYNLLEILREFIARNIKPFIFIDIYLIKRLECLSRMTASLSTTEEICFIQIWS